jgi:hypothetical protein
MTDIPRNKNAKPGEMSERSGPGGFARNSWTESDVDLTSTPVPRTLPSYSLNQRNRPADYLLHRRTNLDLNPPYQRGSVWDLGRRQNLVRSLLMGLPVGSVILNKRYGHDNPVTIVSGSHAGALYGVIDGKQRIETLRAMFDGEFGIPAEWVEERFRGPLVDVEYNGQMVPGVRVDSEDHPFTGLLSDFPISTIEAEVQTLEEEAEIFLLINTGGVEQTAEGLANATVISGH